MNANVFTNLVTTRLDHCRTLLCSKGKEYARHGDRLHNFKTAARMKGTDKFDALHGMWLKHIVSINDMIEDASQGILPSRKTIEDKLSDNINYTLLLEGLLEEAIEETNVPIKNTKE